MNTKISSERFPDTDNKFGEISRIKEDEEEYVES